MQRYEKALHWIEDSKVEGFFKELGQTEQMSHYSLFNVPAAFTSL